MDRTEFIPPVNYKVMKHPIIAGSVLLLSLSVAACASVAPHPRAPLTNPSDMSAARHCQMANGYAQLAARFAREADSSRKPADAARRDELRRLAQRDREVAKEHADAANKLYNRAMDGNGYEAQCTLTLPKQNVPLS
jgi:uncharacterized protein YdbL (DUF1318 family)